MGRRWLSQGLATGLVAAV